MEYTAPIELEIWKKLKTDKTYRSVFFRAKARDEIASQIKTLRTKRNLNQVQFAAKCNMKQSAVSRIEQAEYSAWNFNTLLRIADALEARLRVTFVPVEEVIEQYRQKETAIADEWAQGKATLAVGNVWYFIGSTQNVVKKITTPQRSEATNV